MTNKLINISINVIIFIIPLLIIPIGITNIPYNVLKYSCLICCGLILLVSLILKRKELKFDYIDKTLILLYILIIISTIFSIDVKKSILGSYNRYEGILTFTIYFLTYYSSKYYFQDHKYIKKFSIIVIWICCIIGILQYYNIFPLYKLLNITHVSGFVSSTFGNPNFFGSFLSMCVPAFIALYIIKSDKIYLATSFISFFAMLATNCRSSWVGLFSACIFGIIYIVKNKNSNIIKRMIHIIIGFSIIFIFVLVPPKFITKLSPNTNFKVLKNRLELMNYEIKSTLKYGKVQSSFGSARIHIWQMTLQAIYKNPILGTGPDTLAESLFINSKDNAINFLIQYGCYVDKAHNEYLQIAATMGIPSLILYLSFLAQIFKKQNFIFKKENTFILVVPIISYIVQAFFNISTIGVAPIFYLLLGLIQNKEFKEKL